MTNYCLKLQDEKWPERHLQQCKKRTSWRQEEKLTSDLNQRISELENSVRLVLQRCEAYEQQSEDLESLNSLLEARILELEADNLDLIDRLHKMASELERTEIELQTLRTAKVVVKGSNNDSNKSTQAGN